jgi:hypothetical protein
MESERSSPSRLEEIAARYDPSDPTREFDYYLKRLQIQAITPWLTGTRASSRLRHR